MEEYEQIIAGSRRLDLALQNLILAEEEICRIFQSELKKVGSFEGSSFLMKDWYSLLVTLLRLRRESLRGLLVIHDSLKRSIAELTSTGKTPSSSSEYRMEYDTFLKQSTETE